MSESIFEKPSRRSFLIAGGVVAGGIALAACSSGGAASPTSGGATSGSAAPAEKLGIGNNGKFGAGRKGNTADALLIAGFQWGPPATFNPLSPTAAWPAAANVMQIVYESLLRWNIATGEIMPGLAKEYKVDGTNTITLTAGTGSHIYFGSSGSSTPAGLSVTAGAIGSSTVTLRGSATDLNAALGNLYYQSATHYNGDDTLSLTVDDGGNTGVDGGGTGSDSTAIAIAIRPVNDAPTLSMPSGTKFITDGSFEFIGAGNTISFNDAAGQATMQFMVDSLKSGITHPGSPTFLEDDVIKALQSGEVAFGLNWESTFRDLNDTASSKVAGKMGVSATPTGTSGKRPGVNGAMAFAVTSGSKNPDAAWKLIEFLLRPDIHAEWAVTTGFPPVRRSEVTTRVFRTAVARDPLYEPLGQMYEAAVLWPLYPNSNAIWNILRAAVSSVFRGEAPRTALENAHRQAQQYLIKE